MGGRTGSGWVAGPTTTLPAAGEREGVPDGAFAFPVGRPVHDGAMHDHGRGSTAVEVERVGCAEPLEEPGELFERHAGAPLRLPAVDDDKQQPSIGCPADGRARVSSLAEARCDSLPGEHRPAVADQLRESAEGFDGAGASRIALGGVGSSGPGRGRRV